MEPRPILIHSFFFRFILQKRMLVTRRLVMTQLQPKRFMRKENRTTGQRIGDWLWRGKEWNPDKPPYGHVVQIGDPVLRAKAAKVDFDKVPR